MRRSAPSAATSPTAPQPLWLQYQRIGGNITPATVSAILYEADGGDIYRLVQLANEVRQKDGHLQSCLFQRETALSDLPRYVRPPTPRGRKTPRRRDVEVAEFVEDAIDGAAGLDDEVQSFDELLTHLQGGVFHGHATAQIVWGKENGFVVPRGFKLISQRRFRFRLEDGQLVWSDRWGGTMQGVDLQREYPGHFIVHQPRINGDVPALEGLSRLLVWAGIFRNWSTADWLKLAELSWKPWRIGSYGSNAGKEDIDNLWNVLEKLTTNGVAVHRNDVEVDIRTPEGSGGGRGGKSNHAELCDFMGREMSKAILGQTLTTEAGDRGARSLGEVHDDVRKDIRNNDAKAVAATLRRDLIVPMVRKNFGGVPVSRFGFDTEDVSHTKDFGEALEAFRKAGVRIPEKWAHDMAGIPLPDPGDRVLGDPPDDEQEPDGKASTPASPDEE